MEGDAMNEQNISVTIPSGAVLELQNGSDSPKRFRVVSGEYGWVEVVLPIGGIIRIKPSNIVPRIIMDDVESEPLKGDNVVRFNNGGRHN